MTQLTRKQRLRTLEKEIRSGMEEFYHVGQRLKQIKDDELYREDGFETWEDYCRERWEWSRDYVHKLITASEYRARLPNVDGSYTHAGKGWSEWSVRELTRIPDKKQAARVAAKVLKEVEQSQKQAAKNPEVKPLKLSASVVRAAVDEDLGVDRAKKGAETKRQRLESLPTLENYLRSKLGMIEAITENLTKVPADSWELLEDSEPGLAKRLAEACEELAGLLCS